MSGERRRSRRRISAGVVFYDGNYSDLDEEDDELPDKIVFSNKLYGRSAEVSKLVSVFVKISVSRGGKGITGKLASNGDSSITEPANANTAPMEMAPASPPTSPFVLVTGCAGTGKTALAHAFIDKLHSKAKTKQIKSFFAICGKYQHAALSEDQKQAPFSAIIQAFSALGRLLQEPEYEADMERIRAQVKVTFGEELSTLAVIIPDFTAAIHRRSQPSPCSASDTAATNENAWNRLKYLFQSLFKIICSPSRPLILFLDDLQWADNASLDLLSSLVTDKSITNFLLLAATRNLGDIDDEVQDHPVAKTLRSMKREHGKEVELIDLKELTEENISDFIADTLKLDCTPDEDSYALAEAIYTKTKGNIFFVRQALEELFRKNVLYYCTISFQWTWDMKNVAQLQEDISDNVLQAVTSKITSMPRDLQRIMVVAAYTRSPIDIDTVQYLLPADGDGAIESRDTLVELFDLGVLHGLLSSSVGSSGYRFSHDRIQEAASTLYSGTKREQLRMKIGQRLLEKAFTPEGEDWMLFVAADHLNSTMSTFGEPLFLLKLNLDCGEKAFGMSAFHLSSVYLAKAMQMWERISTPWTSHYDVTLSLFHLSSDVEYILGNFDEGNRLSEEVLKNSTSLEDKLPTYLAMAAAEGKQEHFQVSMKLCKTALCQLKELPKRFHLVNAMLELQWVNRYFRMHEDTAFLSLPRMTDKKKLAAMSLFREGFKRAYQARNMNLFLLMSLRSIRLTVESGISGIAAAGLSGYAIYLSTTGDRESALRISGLVHKVLEVTEDKSATGISRFATLMFVDCWCKPPAGILRDLRDAEKVSFEHGDLQNGFMIWAGAHIFAFASGYPLDELEENGARAIEKIQLYREYSNRSIFTRINETIDYLIGNQDGEIDWEELEEVNVDGSASDSETERFYAYLARLQIGFYFGNLKFAKKMANNLRTVYAEDEMYPNLEYRVFFSGLTFSRLAKSDGESINTREKYLKRARRLAHQMKQIVSTKGKNPHHKFLLMQADIFGAQGYSYEIYELEVAYNTAIMEALSLGYVHMAAVGCELAGETFLHRNKFSLAKRYLRLASLHYGAWGAKAKVADLERVYESYISGRPSKLMKKELPLELLEVPLNSRKDSIDLKSLQSEMTIKTSADLDAIDFFEGSSSNVALDFDGNSSLFVLDVEGSSELILTC